MQALTVEQAWQVLLCCAHGPRPLLPDLKSYALRSSALVAVAADAADAIVSRDQAGRWQLVDDLASECAELFDLYLPMCAAHREQAIVIGHLGQSLDGYVATAAGDSNFVNDAQNIAHLHRMRALCDAVVVGGATVRDDDPRLTTRLVPGPNPLRVVIDPYARLQSTHRIFTDDAVQTLVVTLPNAPCKFAKLAAHVQQVSVPPDQNGNPDLRALLAELHARGCYCVFVEGGGITVSRFVNAGLLTRVQIAVAPLFIGKGRRGIQVTASESLADCLRPPCRLFRMGNDLLFDCDLRAVPGAGASAHNPERAARALPMRIP